MHPACRPARRSRHPEWEPTPRGPCRATRNPLVHLVQVHIRPPPPLPSFLPPRQTPARSTRCSTLAPARPSGSLARMESTAWEREAALSAVPAVARAAQPSCSNSTSSRPATGRQAQARHPRPAVGHLARPQAPTPPARRRRPRQARQQVSRTTSLAHLQHAHLQRTAAGASAEASAQRVGGARRQASRVMRGPHQASLLEPVGRRRRCRSREPVGHRPHQRRHLLEQLSLAHARVRHCAKLKLLRAAVAAQRTRRVPGKGTSRAQGAPGPPASGRNLWDVSRGWGGWGG